jgi:hypothetical protein
MNEAGRQELPPIERPHDRVGVCAKERHNIVAAGVAAEQQFGQKYDSVDDDQLDHHRRDVNDCEPSR